MFINSLAWPRLLLAAVFCFLFVPVVQADPIQLTSGAFSVFTNTSRKINSGTGTGPNISFAGGSTDFDCPPVSGCGPTDFGSLTTLLRSYGGNGGSLIVDGVTYHAFSVGFFFDDTMVSGNISVFENVSVPLGTPALFSFQYFGYGFQTTTVSEGGTFRTFHITNAVSTPEPVSLALLAIGLFGLGAKTLVFYHKPPS